MLSKSPTKIGIYIFSRSSEISYFCPKIFFFIKLWKDSFIWEKRFGTSTEYLLSFCFYLFFHQWDRSAQAFIIIAYISKQTVLLHLDDNDDDI